MFPVLEWAVLVEASLTNWSENKKIVCEDSCKSQPKSEGGHFCVPIIDEVR